MNNNEPHRLCKRVNLLSDEDQQVLVIAFHSLVKTLQGQEG